MALCEIPEGILESCSSTLGGVSRLWVASAQNVTSLTDTEPDGIVDAIVMATGTRFYEINLEAQVAGADSIPQGGTGSAKFFQETVAIQYQTDDKQAGDGVYEAMVYGKTVAIVKFASGKFAIFGKNIADTANPLTFLGTANGITSGIASTDFAGYNITLQADQPSIYNEVLDQSVVDAVLTPAP